MAFLGFKLILKIAIISVLIFLSCFGWRFRSRYFLKLSEEQKDVSQNLQATVSEIVEVFGVRNYQFYENLDRTADYLIKKMESFGYTVDIEAYKIEEQEFKNLVFNHSPDLENSPFFILGAHYDSCFNPGADDNASGVAVLLEIARLLKDEKLKIPVKFVFFVNEEPPFFHTEKMGSRVYAKRLKTKKQVVRGAIVFEMLGYYREELFSQRYFPLIGPFYPNRANFAAVIGNFQSHSLVRQVSKAFKAKSNFPLENLTVPGFVLGTNFSDHWSFWQEGYQAVMVTDTAFMRSPHYHTSGDLPKTLDYNRMALVTFGFKEAIVQLANLDVLK